MPIGIIPQELATATNALQAAVARFQVALRDAGIASPDGPVFAALRAWRTDQAREKQVPPYVIASDAVLRAIESAKPADVGELQSIRGIGQSKAAMYGEQILHIVAHAAETPA